MEMKYNLLFSLVILSVCFLKTSANPSQLKGRRNLQRNDDNYDDSCEKGPIKHKNAIRDESELNNSNESDSCDEEQKAEPSENSEISELIRDILSKIKHTDKKKKQEMNFKAEYDSSSSNNEDCFQDKNKQIDDYINKPMKRRQQPRRSFNSDDDSDFNGAPRRNMNQRKGKFAENNSDDDSDFNGAPRRNMNQRKGKFVPNDSSDDSDFNDQPRKIMNKRKSKIPANNSNDDSDFNDQPRRVMNQRKGKIAAKAEQQPKKQPIAADDDCDTDDYETALEMKILKRLQEAQSNDDSDCDENIVKPKKTIKNNAGNKQQIKPKATMKPNGQVNDVNKDLPCDLDNNDSSDETNFRGKKSDAAVQNELKNLMNKQQTANKVKSNQFANRNQLKSTTEKNTKQVIPINLGKKVQLKKPIADKDCNSKELVPDMKKAVPIPKDDKTKYQSQSKKFIEQNNIEKEICTNGGDDSKQPDNIVLLQIYNQIETNDNKESVVVNGSGSDEEKNDREGKSGKNSKSGKKSGKKSGRNNNSEDCETEFEKKNDRLERRLENEREYEEKERYLRLREEKARNEERQRMERNEERQQMERNEEIREKNEERARILENERNEELFIRRTIKERQEVLERQREINAIRNRNLRQPNQNVRASHTNRNGYQNYNNNVAVPAPAPVNQRNNNNQMNRHEGNQGCFSNEREAYEERQRREEEYYEERKEEEEEREEKAEAKEADREACEAAKKEKSKFMTEDENGDKHFKFSMEMDF